MSERVEDLANSIKDLARTGLRKSDVFHYLERKGHGFYNETLRAVVYRQAVRQIAQEIREHRAELTSPTPPPVYKGPM